MSNTNRYLLTNLNNPYWENRNYSLDVWKKEIERLNSSTKPILGEIGDEYETSTIISLSNISHIITNLTLENNYCIYGDVEILDTPNGIKAKYYLEKDICTFRIRAMGDQNNVEIITWDIVSK